MGDGVGIFRDADGSVATRSRSSSSLEGRAGDLHSPTSSPGLQPRLAPVREMQATCSPCRCDRAGGADARGEPRRPQPTRPRPLRRLLGRAQHRRPRGDGEHDMTLTPTRVVKRDELAELVEARMEAEKGMSEDADGGRTRRLQIWRGDLTEGELVDFDVETRARDGRTRRGPRGPAQPGSRISRSDGTARPPNAAPAAPRSTASRG